MRDEYETMSSRSRLRCILCSTFVLLTVFPLLFSRDSSAEVHPSSFRLHPLSGPSSLIHHPSQAPPRKIDPEALKKYIGRYQLDAGIIPISTLDVTLENNELWVKPSVVKKRRLLHKSKTVFLDEIEGTALTFNKDVDGKIVSVEFEYEGAKYTAGKISLPPPSLKGNTTFRLKGYPDASIVALAGSFNNWNQSQYVFGREGDEWVCRIDLEPGMHAYKFIIDGNWLLDPANPNTKDDDYGVKNSVIIVVKPSGRPDRP
jgi:hypothetical protein